SRERRRHRHAIDAIPIAGALAGEPLRLSSNPDDAIVIKEESMGILNDHDPVETQEWVDSLRSVLHYAGPERAQFLLSRLREEALRTGTMPPFLPTTPYVNTIRPEREEKSPGTRQLEHQIRSAIRWNAVA